MDRNPTEAELRILNELWRREPATVREVHEAFVATRPVAYTTVLKLLQIMLAKGLVERVDACRPHRYRPVEERTATESLLIRDLVKRAFGGSANALVLRALSEAPIRADTRAAIEALLAADLQGRE